jgi:predicted permease
LAGPTRSSNHRASAAVLLGIVGVLAVPAAIVAAQRSAGISLLDAGWAIPVALLGGGGAWVLARAAVRRIRLTLERSGGAGRVRAARILALASICIALSGSIAIGFYELLLRLEK